MSFGLECLPVHCKLHRLHSDFDNQTGSTTLRSDQTNYSRGVFNTGWHEAREAEPRDYDISRGPIRNLHFSTYKRLPTITDGSLPETTYQEHYKQVFLKPYYSELDKDRRMVTIYNLKNTHIERDTGDPKRGFLAPLPRYYPDYNNNYLKSRRFARFDPFEPEPEVPADFPDKSAAYRKCRSQFTDTTDYRRPGRNTWTDESGLYANTHFKRAEFVPRNPITLHHSV